MKKPLATTPYTFCTVGPAVKKLKIFSVNGKIEAEHALEKASNLLEMLVMSLDDAAMEVTKLEGQHAWLTLHAAESAKAIIDSLWSTYLDDED
jgi:hypothetical protein